MKSCAPQFRALMRRNLLYRKRYFVATLLEIALPVCFAGLLLWIKNLADDSSSFIADVIPPNIPSGDDAMQILSFGDYVTAIVAKRQCKYRGNGVFDITGLPHEGYNWQVPFVKCDSRRCKEDGEDAYKYCVYPILAVAAHDKSDEGGRDRALEFKAYVNDRYPQLKNPDLTHFPNGYDLVQVFESDDAIHKYVKDGSYGNTGKEQIGLAVVFEGNDPLDYKYSIRVNSTNFNAPEEEARPGVTTTPDTSRLLNTFARSDTACIPLGGAPEQGPFDTSCTGQYIYNGFLTTQRLVQDWIIESSGAKKAGFFVSEHGVRYIKFPAFAYETKGFYGELAAYMPLLMTLGILYPCAAMTSYVVQEKELRQKELMKMMGVTDWEIGWSWFLSFWSMEIVTATFVTLICSKLFQNSDTFLLFFFWQLCFLGFVVMSLFMSTLFSKTTRGVLFLLLFVFLGYFLTAVEDIATGNPEVISLISLHPVAAMAYALQELGRLEDTGVGVTATSIQFTDAPSGYTFTNAFANLIISNIFLGVLTWYLNRAIPPAYGQALPFWFPFTRSYWCPGKARSEDCSDADGATEGAAEDSIPLEPVTDLLQQQARNGENIEIKNLRKQFKEKVAVDGLNLSIYNGQITALLGHNGAGKTTTISMLTGALSPTEGTATILGKDIRQDMSQIRGNIGICLQHDCLFPKLTVREHLQFFSRLKGMYDSVPFAEAEANVDQAIRDVALEEKSLTYASNLSGGMKRKLSLAMAFCGGSKVVFLDEPTSGMDPFSRRFCWTVIRQYRQERCIILTTHFMDEADILGDRIAIMAEGRLRCCGSSLFLKKTYGVGYQLTIEKSSKSHSEGTEASDDVLKNPVAKDDYLKEIVVGTVSEATVLSNIGTELSFQLPLGTSNKFGAMLEQLDTAVEEGSITTYGVSITTLDEVFLLVARGEEMSKRDYQSAHFSSKEVANTDDGDEKSVQSRMDLENENLFGTHVSALLKKRAASFKRDKKAWCCTTILPSLFVLVGLLLLKFAGPDRDLIALPLDLNDYNEDVSKDIRNPIPFNNPGSSFTCSPGDCTLLRTSYILDETNETYYFCGGPALLANKSQTCSINTSDVVLGAIDEAGAGIIGGDLTNLFVASLHTYAAARNFTASQYGGLFFNVEPNSTTFEGKPYGESVSELCARHIGDYMKKSECELYGTGFSYTVSYNFTALHSTPLFQMLADETIIRQAPGLGDFKLSGTIHPLPITKKEENYGQADDAFILWFLVVLSFPFIAGAYATFVVSERESKAKHLQTVAGVKPSAYWLSTLMWDFINYLIPFSITIILIFAFDVSVFTTTERNVLGGVLCLLLLFGPASASLSYCTSFMFKSPSLCNITIIISGFLIGMGASIAAIVLKFIGLNPFDPKENLVQIAKIIEWIGRFFPTFCLGKGLLYAINIESFDFLMGGGGQLNAWDAEVLLIEVIFLAAESVVYLILAIQIDILSSNPEAMRLWQKLFCFLQRSSENSAVASIPDDDDVVNEEDRVLNGEANSDAIVMSELTKVYSNGKIAVNQLSLGIPAGECFGLLGINGAGKTTTMGMLTAEFPPTSGDATLARFSLRREPEKTRRRIGYCPQFDALLENMTGREHVELYASIKGIPASSVKAAAAEKLAQVGLSEKDSDRLSANYSGGMKRRLSLACATIGQPQLVFLDECSTGVDPVARREIWQMVSDLVSHKSDYGRTSVILTTHSMEECEALCPRIGIMANGKLRCLGSAQHLKSKFGRGFQLELKVAASRKEDADFQAHLATLARSKGAGVSDEEAVPADVEVFFNLQEAQAALHQLTSDDYLASMLNESNPMGYGILKDATSQVGVPQGELTSFVTNELRMRDLGSFVGGRYPTAILRERQDMKARFEVDSEDVSIAQLFACIEENKDKLHLSDYGISQTSLEQVFNMHAAEAERLKQGRMDG